MTRSRLRGLVVAVLGATLVAGSFLSHCELTFGQGVHW